MRMVHLVVEFLLLFYCYPKCIYSSRDEPANVHTASTVCSKREQGLDAYLVPQFTKEEQKHALALMVVAHSAGLLPPTLNDVPEFREYINFISKGRYTLPHRTKTTALEDEAFLEKRDLVIVIVCIVVSNSYDLFFPPISHAGC